MSCDFIALANTGVQALHPYQAGKPIEELQRELGLDHVVKLASNENPLGPSPVVLKACAEAAKDLHLYPDANGFELKKALSEHLGINSNQLTLGNGSNDVLDLIARAYIQSGVSAVFSQHAFVVYPIATQACGGRSIVVPAKDWGHDLDAMAAAIEPDTKVVFVANPNNPTGTHLEHEALVTFMRKVPADVVVVMDEAYVEYAEDESAPTALDLLGEFPNVIVTRTFSKAYGLAGLRVGYSVSNPQIADVLNRVRAPFNVNSLALVAARAALQDQDYLERSRAVNRAGMQQLIEGFDALGLPYIPSVGNFLAVDFGRDAAPIYQKLLEGGVIVRPVAGYQMPNYLRVSIGLEEENRALLNLLPSVLESLDD